MRRLRMFQRMKAVFVAGMGTYQAVTEDVPVRTIDPQERRANEIPGNLCLYRR